MTSVQMKGVSVFMSLLVYGSIFLLTCADNELCTFLHSVIYPTIASDYLNMIVIVTATYSITYAILYLLYRDKKRRG